MGLVGPLPDEAMFYTVLDEIANDARTDLEVGVRMSVRVYCQVRYLCVKVAGVIQLR